MLIGDKVRTFLRRRLLKTVNCGIMAKAPLTLTIVEEALDRLHHPVSPGEDGISALFLQTVLEHFLSHDIGCNWAFEIGPLPPD